MYSQNNITWRLLSSNIMHWVLFYCCLTDKFFLSPAKLLTPSDRNRTSLSLTKPSLYIDRTSCVNWSGRCWAAYLPQGLYPTGPLWALKFHTRRTPMCKALCLYRWTAGLLSGRGNPMYHQTRKFNIVAWIKSVTKENIWGNETSVGDDWGDRLAY